MGGATGIVGRRVWRWSVVLLALASVGALVAIAPHQRVLHRVEAEERDVHALLSENAGREADAVLDVANESTALDAHVRDRRRTTLAADATQARVDDVEHRLSRLEAAVVETEAQIAATNVMLDRISEVLGLQRLFIEPLQTCTHGIADANAALVTGDHASAADVLDRATASCLQVRSGSSTPAHPYDFPDPHVVRGPSGRWWAYATNSSAGAVQMISSADLVTRRVRSPRSRGGPRRGPPGRRL